MLRVDVTRVWYTLKNDREITHPCILQNSEDTRRIHFLQTRKSFFTHMRFPWGTPEFPVVAAGFPKKMRPNLLTLTHTVLPGHLQRSAIKHFSHRGRRATQT